MSSYHTILLAIDKSECSLRAAAHAFSMAHNLKAKLSVIYVIEEEKTMGNIDGGIMPDQALEKVRKEVHETLSSLVTNFSDEIITYTPVGNPKVEILNAARKIKADLIVMGTHGKTGLKHLLMGSVAEHVLRHANIPVLIVPIKNQE